MKQSGRSRGPRVESYRMFVDGRWVDSEGGETTQVVNPADERVIATVPKGTREDAKTALEAAARAQPGWEDIAPLQRAGYLQRIAVLIRRDRERLAEILTG